MNIREHFAETFKIHNQNVNYYFVVFINITVEKSIMNTAHKIHFIL